MAPITLMFVCSCSRQMSENHPLTDLFCQPLRHPPSPPTNRIRVADEKALAGKRTASSQAHTELRQHCNGILPACLPSTTFPSKPPGSTVTHVFLACFLPKIWKDLGLQAFETRLKGLFYSNLRKKLLRGNMVGR